MNGTKLTDEQIIVLTIALDKLFCEVLTRRPQEDKEICLKTIWFSQPH